MKLISAPDEYFIEYYLFMFMHGPKHPLSVDWGSRKYFSFAMSGNATLSHSI